MVSQDGTRIAFIGYPASDVTYEMPRLHAMNTEGSEVRQLSGEFDHSARSLIWAGNGRGVYFTAEDERYVNVLYMSLTGDVRAVTEGKHTLTLNSVERSSRVGVGIGTSYRVSTTSI